MRPRPPPRDCSKRAPAEAPLGADDPCDPPSRAGWMLVGVAMGTAATVVLGAVAARVAFGKLPEFEVSSRG